MGSKNSKSNHCKSGMPSTVSYQCFASGPKSCSALSYSCPTNYPQTQWLKTINFHFCELRIWASLSWVPQLEVSIGITIRALARMQSHLKAWLREDPLPGSLPWWLAGFSISRAVRLWASVPRWVLTEAFLSYLPCWPLWTAVYNMATGFHQSEPVRQPEKMNMIEATKLP